MALHVKIELFSLHTFIIYFLHFYIEKTLILTCLALLVKTKQNKKTIFLLVTHNLPFLFVFVICTALVNVICIRFLSGNPTYVSSENSSRCMSYPYSTYCITNSIKLFASVCQWSRNIQSTKTVAVGYKGYVWHFLKMLNVMAINCVVQSLCIHSKTDIARKNQNPSIRTKSMLWSRR